METIDNTIVEKLCEFHRAFNCVMHSEPIVVDPETALLRSKLIVSECAETVEAMANKNLVEILDGLVDILYVTIGTAVTYGMGDILLMAFMEVHKNNMSKLGPDGKPLKDSSGKVIKPAGYKKVDLEQFILLGRALPDPATLTCFGCDCRVDCEYVDDPYNTNGDCLALK